MTDELKPCPFCGGEAKYYHRDDDSGWSNTDWVSCSGDCGASTCMHETKEQAVSAWNTRTDLAEAIVKAALERAAPTTGSHAEDRPLRYSLDFNDGYIDACVAASRTIRALASDPAEVAAIIAKAGEKDNG